MAPFSFVSHAVVHGWRTALSRTEVTEDEWQHCQPNYNREP